MLSAVRLDAAASGADDLVGLSNALWCHAVKADMHVLKMPNFHEHLHWHP